MKIECITKDPQPPNLRTIPFPKYSLFINSNVHCIKFVRFFHRFSFEVKFDIECKKNKC